MQHLSYQSQEADFLNATRDELAIYCNASPSLSSSCYLRRLSDNIIAKIRCDLSETEYENQLYAWARLNGPQLRVPRPIRYFIHGGHNGVETGFLLMEYISGCTLDTQTMESSTTKRVAGAVRFMHSIRGSKPGPLFGRAQGFPWGDGNVEREFSSREELEECLNLRLAGRKGGRIDLRDQIFSFCHMELVPRNIMINDHGEVVFLDWATASFYPAYFEAAALYHYGAHAPQFFDDLYNLLEVVDKQKDVKRLDKVQVASIGRVF